MSVYVFKWSAPSALDFPLYFLVAANTHLCSVTQKRLPACLHVCVKGTKRFAPRGSLYLCVFVQCAFDAATEAKFNLRARRPGFKSNKNANWPLLCAAVLFWFYQAPLSN
jgi:hypothetical protein